MSRQDWDDEYDQPLFIFPDDEDESDDRDTEDGVSAVSSDAGDEWRARSESMRRSASAPVEYPEGSLGAFSTPEDYESHMAELAKEREEESENEQEYDDPIFLFPPDNVDDDDDDDDDNDDDDGRSRSRLFSSSDDGDIDDSVGISFSRYSAENKEGEFFFMPFLDIPDEVEDDEDEDEDEDEGEEIAFSFRKVDAEQVKKEKEFFFMPFLNVSEEPEEEEKEEEHQRQRGSSKGPIFDEGLYLIPLESEEEEEPPEEETEKEPEEDEDTGISFVSAVGGVVPTAPKVPRVDERKTTLRSEPASAPQNRKKKKTPPKQNSTSGGNKKKSQKPTGKSGSGGKNPGSEEQFRAAMRNVSPEIRAAVKNDPIQRAALEQAVRIALVQQAAQEAVEKATGRPVFGGSSAASGKKKRRIPKPPQSQQKPMSSFLGSSSRAGSMSFSPITLRTPYSDDGGVSEFGVTEDTSKPAASTEHSSSSGLINTAPGVTEANQDSVLNLLKAAGIQPSGSTQEQNPDNAQDAALDALNAKNSQKQRAGSPYQSPAAVRAAMRSGFDVDTSQPAAAAAAPARSGMSAAEQEQQAKRSGCLMWIIVAFVVFFVGLIGILVLPNISKQNSFDKAVDLMNSGRYTQAIEIFETFKSSDTKYYDDSRLNISECAYRQASLYYEDGKYYEAYNLLMDKAAVTDETTDLALKCNYYYAEQRYAEGDWQTAATAYANLIGMQYQDSQEKYNICQYQLAAQNAESGNYLQAYQGFSILGDYSDALYRSAVMICRAWEVNQTSVTQEQLTNAVIVLNENASNGEALDLLNSMYNKAVELRGLEQYAVAYTSFSALGDYSDSPYQAALSLYGIWKTEPAYGTLTQRERAMNELRARVGNDEAAAALNSAGFNPIRLQGNWTDGTNRMYLRRTEEGSEQLTLTLELVSPGGGTISMESTSVGFDGNVVYRLTDPDDSASRELLFEVTGFDSLTAASPGSITFYCILNSSEYAMDRS